MEVWPEPIVMINNDLLQDFSGIIDGGGSLDIFDNPPPSFLDFENPWRRAWLDDYPIIHDFSEAGWVDTDGDGVLDGREIIVEAPGMQDDSGSNLSYRLFSNGYAALYERSWSWDVFGGVQFQYQFTGWATYQLHSNWSLGAQFGIGSGGEPEVGVSGTIGGGVTFEPISGDPPASGP